MIWGRGVMEGMGRGCRRWRRLTDETKTEMGERNILPCISTPTFPSNVSCGRKEEVNARARKGGCLFLIEMHPETPEL